MKKRVFAIFACLLLVLGVGCGKKEAAEIPDTDNSTAEAENPEPLDQEELLDLYAEATDIYAELSTMNFSVDTEKRIQKEDDKVYYKIDDERFESYDDFSRYLNQYFTKDLIQKEDMIDDDLFTEGKDGCLYALAAGRGTNIFYAGYAVGEAEASEESIRFDATAYYTMDEPYDGEIFTEAPEEPIDFETETYTFKMVPEDGTWKFDNFHLFY